MQGGNIVKTVFLSLVEPKTADAKGLKECIIDLLKCFDDINLINYVTLSRKIFSLCTDVTSVNTGCNSGLALLKENFQWLLPQWCICHRLELALQDAFKSTILNEIREMLMRLFYLYKKSLKLLRSLRELSESISELTDNDDAELIVKDNILSDAGIIPLKSYGTRWIAHLISAIKRAVKNFGLYLSSIESATVEYRKDKAKRTGYINKWKQYKYALCMGFFIQMLSPMQELSLTWQRDDVTIVDFYLKIKDAIEAIEKIKTICSNDKALLLPFVKAVLDNTHVNVYQNYEITHIKNAKSIIGNNSVAWCDTLLACLKARFYNTNEVLDSMIMILNSQTWLVNEPDSEDDEDASGLFTHYDEAIDKVVNKFCLPLFHAGCELESLKTEFYSVLQYAKVYLKTKELTYKEV